MMQAQQRVADILAGHLEAVTACFEMHEAKMIEAANLMATALQNGNKLLSCGNGGSACDAMHFAGECVGRFVNDRKALPAIALTADSGILTAVGNDYGFENIFSRQVEALGNAGDVLLAISTSGKSPNVLQALEVAQKNGLKTVLLTGEKGKSVANCDINIWVPSAVTAHIQEVHITIAQLMIALIEDNIL